jgi:hypothetical protein
MAVQYWDGMALDTRRGSLGSGGRGVFLGPLFSLSFSSVGSRDFLPKRDIFLDDRDGFGTGVVVAPDDPLKLRPRVVERLSDAREKDWLMLDNTPKVRDFETFRGGECNAPFGTVYSSSGNGAILEGIGIGPLIFGRSPWSKFLRCFRYVFHASPRGSFGIFSILGGSV